MRSRFQGFRRILLAFALAGLLLSPALGGGTAAQMPFSPKRHESSASSGIKNPACRSMKSTDA